MPASPAELDRLVCQAAAGEVAALETLLLHFHDSLLQFIRSALLPGSAPSIGAEDVLQETLIEAFRGVRSLESRGHKAFFAWLQTVARSRMLNQIKAAKALKRGGGRRELKRRKDTDATATSIINLIAAGDGTPSLIIRRKEAVHLVAQAVKRLEPEKRQIIELRYGREMSIQDVAARVGKSEAAVKMTIHRAIKELRHAMTGEIEGLPSRA
jgi:RNA polymerase sigma-70 factor (ECF subfamily)